MSSNNISKPTPTKGNGGGGGNGGLGKVQKTTVVDDIIATNNSGRSIESLQALVEQYASKEHGITKMLVDLDGQIEEYYNAIIEAKAERNQRTGKGALSGAIAITKATEKEMKLKENMLTRLRRMEDRHNADLVVMKERINTYRVDAIDQNKNFDHMAFELQTIKQALVIALEKSNVILGERNELSEQLKAVRAEDVEHKANFEIKLKDLNGQIDTMQIALVKAAKAGKLSANSDTDSKNGDGPGSGNLTEEQEEETRSNILKIDHLIREYEVVVSDLHQQTSQLQEVFKHMIAQANLERLDQLVERFAEEEAFKYEIFGFVAHINGETKQYEEMLRDVKQAHRHYIQELATQAQAQANATAELRKELETVEGQLVMYTKTKQNLLATAAKVLRRLVRLYSVMGGKDIYRLITVAEMARKEYDTDQQLKLLNNHDGGSSNESKDDRSWTKANDDENDPSLVISKDDVITVLGDLEQLTSDTCLMFIGLLRFPGVRRFLIDGLDNIHNKIQQELEILQKEESGQMNDKVPTDSSSSSSSEEEVTSMHTTTAFHNYSPRGRERYDELNSYMVEYAHMKDALLRISIEQCENMLKLIRREPFVPAKAVMPSRVPAVSETVASTVDKLTMIPPPVVDTQPKRIFNSPKKPINKSSTGTLKNSKTSPVASNKNNATTTTMTTTTIHNLTSPTNSKQQQTNGTLTLDVLTLPSNTISSTNNNVPRRPSEQSNSGTLRNGGTNTSTMERLPSSVTLNTTSTPQRNKPDSAGNDRIILPELLPLDSGSSSNASTTVKKTNAASTPTAQSRSVPTLEVLTNPNNNGPMKAAATSNGKLRTPKAAATTMQRL